MTGARAPSVSMPSPMGRRAFLGRAAVAGAAAWVVPTVVSMDPVAAAVGSCTGISVYEFTSGLEGWTIDNSWGDGIDGLWNHNTEASRDGGSLHYGRGTSGTYQTGSGRSSGRVYSPEFEMGSVGPNSITFSVWRQVEVEKKGNDRLSLRIIGPQNALLYSVASTGDTSGFENHIITLPTASNGRTLRFQFEFDTRNGQNNDYEGVYIGRVQVTGCPTVG